MARASRQATPGVDTQGPRPNARFGAVTRAAKLGMPLMGSVKGGGRAAPTNRQGNIKFDQSTTVKVNPNPAGWGRKSSWNGGGTPGVGTKAPVGKTGTVTKGVVSKQSFKPMARIQKYGRAG